MADKFSLADVMRGKVSGMDTGREQIEYIGIEYIDEDPNNFYQLSDLDALASNIALVGLQQPLRVRACESDRRRVTVVSGHRRLAAIRQLVEEGHEDLRQIPCIRDRDGDSPEMQELRLIYANSGTRKLTAAELGKQAERIEELLYQLKEQGVEFPGRMRDHVAEICQVSAAKLARLNVIREGLDECWKAAFEEGTLRETPAYALARLPEEYQQLLAARYNPGVPNSLSLLTESNVELYGDRLARIDELFCECGEACHNRFKKQKHALSIDRWTGFYCDKCCSGCPNLVACKHACPRFADQVAKAKAEAKAEKSAQLAAAEYTERPYVSAIMAMWSRFGEARARAGVSAKDYLRSMGRCLCFIDAEKLENMERLQCEFNRFTSLPFGDNRHPLDLLTKLVGAADLLDVSVDYLLCRTDEPSGGNWLIHAEGGEPRRWIPGDQPPERPMDVVARFDLGGDKMHRIFAKWSGAAWTFKNGETVDSPVVDWFPLPEEV